VLGLDPKSSHSCPNSPATEKETFTVFLLIVFYIIIIYNIIENIENYCILYQFKISELISLPPSIWIIGLNSEGRTGKRHKTIHSGSIFVRIKCLANSIRRTKKFFLLPTFRSSHCFHCPGIPLFLILSILSTNNP